MDPLYQEFGRATRHSLSDIDAHGGHRLRHEEGNALHDCVLPGIIGPLLGWDLQDSGHHLPSAAVAIHNVADEVCAALSDEDHGDVFARGEFIELFLDVLLVRLRIHNEEVLLAAAVDVANPRQQHPCDGVLISDHTDLHVRLAGELLPAHGAEGDRRYGWCRDCAR